VQLIGFTKLFTDFFFWTDGKKMRGRFAKRVQPRHIHVIGKTISNSNAAR
jgi:hypothetical protein